MRKTMFAALAALLLIGSAQAQTPAEQQALELYRNGLYARAAELFDQGKDARSRGYSALCALALKTPGYEKQAVAFLDECPESVLAPQVEYRLALDLFDQARYEEASRHFNLTDQDALDAADHPEYLYKRAYSLFGTGDYERAERLFDNVVRLPHSDFTAPAQYSLGYISYAKGDFRDAADWFMEAAEDPRFQQLANYYILECRFMEKDYAYVVKFGEDLFNKVPVDRQPHLARIMSESYLVLGDPQKARTYYQKNLEGKANRSRTDYFHAGSVLYSVEDWQGAVDNFTQMTDRTDSLGQIANYQLGYSYIQTRNKVAALEAFRDAARYDYDPSIQEDAHFNYAKLSFDLNNDASVFNDYLKRYNALQKGNQIYSYMAMAALANHDWEGAVAAYDNIDELDPRMRSNYMKAYFLRAVQLMGSGAWRDAVPHLKAAAYYSPRQDPFNQLARYWTAEAYYRDARYAEARSILTDLYNLSALEGRKEGELIPYHIAYTFFREKNYNDALKWFDYYMDGPHDHAGADAATRIGDCYFFKKEYTTAVAAFERKLEQYPDANDIYPNFRAGVACGLLRDFSRKAQLLEPVKQASPAAPYWSEAMYELGRAYVSIGENEDAVRTFRTLRSATDDLNYATKSLLELAMIARNQGNDTQALDYYKQVVNQGTDYTEDALLAIESIYRTRGEPDAYLAYVNGLGGKASRTEAQKESVYFSTAEQIFLSENWSKAVTTLQGYLEKYPSGAYQAKALFYLAESYRMTGAKERASDCYVEAIETGLEGSFEESALLRFGDLSMSRERYAKAYSAYQMLLEKAQLEDNRLAARRGMMRAAFKAREWEDAIQAADLFRADTRISEEEKREAGSVLAKAYMATSRRAEALSLLEELAAAPSTSEGAEACYLLIQDRFDRAAFDGIQERVYDFSTKAGGQNYWLAKAFIVLGDTFAEQGNLAQARATFESIRSGYTPQGPEDDVPDQVALRLKKLNL